MPSLKERISGRVEQIRARRPLVDHLVRMVEHFNLVKGNLQAGAVTYFAFLSFFPILALGFAVVGFIARISAEADFQSDLVEAIGQVLPGLVTEDPAETDKIQIEDIQDAAPGILSIGLPVLLYSGLGWLSAMREALVTVFETPRAEQPNFVVGKARDLASLATIGLTLVVAVAIAGLVGGFSRDILGWLSLEGSLVAQVLLWVVTVLVGLLANALLFLALFRLLAAPEAPLRSLWSGAVLGAVGFELLKQVSRYLLASTKDQPAFQAFGIALILVVWINYFSRVVMYAASWAHTSREAREQRETAQQAHAAADADSPHAHPAPRRTPSEEPAAPAAFVAGAAAMLGAVAVLRRTVKKGEG